MLLSMTGYGEARRETAECHIVAEVRAVNNRYFKLHCRSPEGFASLEGEIERLIRGVVSRGTVSVNYRLESASGDDGYTLDTTVLKNYWDQIHGLAEQLHASPPSDFGLLLQLPGAVRERKPATAPQELWPAVSETLSAALQQLQEFRRKEGASMLEELKAQSSFITGQLQQVTKLAPDVIKDYRARLAERVQQALADASAEVGEGELLREVSLFADRCDITEEITRLQSHLQQFEAVVDDDESQGRKLEFLGQEMFREINTIGSKANSVPIAHCVVEMKAAVEKIREILQNVE